MMNGNTENLVEDRRGVSQVFGYVLTLTITTILVGGLLLSAGSFMDDQRRTTAEGELRVVGQQISGDISAVDRLSRSTGRDTAKIERSIPQRIVGSSFTIAIKDDANGPTRPYIELRTTQPEVTVTVGIALSKGAHIAEGSFHGGQILVEHDGTSLVIGNV